MRMMLIAMLLLMKSTTVIGYDDEYDGSLVMTMLTAVLLNMLRIIVKISTIMTVLMMIKMVYIM